MVSSTLRQKFIYNTPFNDDDFPLVKLDGDIDNNSIHTFKINASKLYELEENDFGALLKDLKLKFNSILIINNYKFKSQNKNLINGSKAHILAFAYLFKKNGYKCGVIELYS